MNPNEGEHVRDKLAALIALVSLGRSIEVQKLEFESIHFDEAKNTLWLDLERKKNPAKLAKTTIALVGRDEPLICPVTIWKVYNAAVRVS